MIRGHGNICVGLYTYLYIICIKTGNLEHVLLEVKIEENKILLIKTIVLSNRIKEMNLEV